MADPASLVLIFSGMIAFVPNLTRTDPAAVTALLLADHGGHGHEQFLRVPRSILTQACPAAYCTEITLPTGTSGKATYCNCRLANSQITIAPMPSQTRPLFPDRPSGQLPSNTNASSIEWLVRLRNIDPDFAELDRQKFARFDGSQLTFRPTEMATCAFDEEVAQSRTVFKQRFIQQGHVVHEQAVAEMAVFLAPVGTATTRVTLTVQPQNFTLNLVCQPGPSCPVILLNTPPRNENCQQCSDCITGDHFAEYWRLTGRSVGGGALPRRECNVKSVLSTQPPRLCPDYSILERPESESRNLALLPEPTRKALLSTLFVTVGNRVICPMAVIEP
ncbi:MAG: hypothetical protein ABUT39_14930 [Acidobacteriota bacterium]